MFFRLLVLMCRPIYNVYFLRSSISKNTKPFTSLLALLSEQDALTEEHIDYALQLCIPPAYHNLQCVDEFTAMVPFLHDVSRIRAFVVKYFDELQNDTEVKNNILGMYEVKSCFFFSL